MRIQYVDLVSCNLVCCSSWDCSESNMRATERQTLHALLIVIDSLVNFLGFSKTHLSTNTMFHLSFQSSYPLFLFLSLLYRLRLPVQLSKRNGKSGCHCFVPNVKVFNVSLLLRLTIGLHRQPLSDSGNFSPFIPNLLKVFMVNEY